MRHRRKGRKLGRTSAQRKAMLSGLVTSLFAGESITTTVARAKEARRLAERLITFAKRGDLAARRMVLRTVHKKSAVKRLFEDIAPRYSDREGGYTRIVRLGPRKGDCAEMAILELVAEHVIAAKKVRKRGLRKRKEKE